MGGILWRERAVTVKMVPGWKKDEPVELSECHPGYQKLIRNWGSANSCMSMMIFPAMYNCDNKYTLEQHGANKDGTRKRRVTRSAKEILEGLKWKDQQVFVLVCPVGDGRIDGFFSTEVPGIKEFVFNWA